MCSNAGGGGGGVSYKVGDVFTRERHGFIVTYKILERHKDGPYVEVIKSNMDGISRYATGKKLPVPNKFLEISKKTKKK